MTLTKTATLQPIPYLSFNGNCREAVDFYTNLFGARLKSIMTFGETPMAGSMKPEELNNVVNAQLELPGGLILMAGDAPSMYPYPGHTRGDDLPEPRYGRGGRGHL
jgi:PhnB protein